MIDRRIKFRGGEQQDVLALLLAEIRKLGYPLLESFISGSPKVESLSTNPAGRVKSVLHGATGSIAHSQLYHVAREVLAALVPDRLDRGLCLDQVASGGFAADFG